MFYRHTGYLAAFQNVTSGAAVVIYIWMYTTNHHKLSHLTLHGSCQQVRGIHVDWPTSRAPLHPRVRQQSHVVYAYTDTVYNVCNILRHLSPWCDDGDSVTSCIRHMLLMHSLSLLTGCPGRRRSIATVATEIFEMHQGTHILQVSGFVSVRFYLSLVTVPAVRALWVWSHRWYGDMLQ